MLVEPNERDCREATALLRGLGYEVIALSDVEAAVAVFPYTRADLVITAHPLPLPDSGRDFATFVKQASPGTTVIGVVARGGIEVVRDALKGTCDQLISKPVTLEVLQPALAELLGPTTPPLASRPLPRPAP